ncbi:tetratricopeptide repeat protein [Pseudoxanthomonas sp. CF125]|uniref:heme biosynthesis protein HemY n=1 Tax=Pseudoxanthomonas sp. CF125 TaxID=1855303 RepID=UPI00088D999C|nr:tetratricopeptide repeat protein [Pseudoxanthomonas sp. CF125]SDR13684.1 Tetratricopeptide repeat-containing protein [Pseudoxanthomonas sp. CF125]
MLFRNCKQALLSLAIVSLLGTAAVGVDAQTRDRSERSSKKQENLYPNATREEPKAKGAPKLQSKLQKLIDIYNKDDYAATRTQADELAANPAATDYDKAVAAQLASQAAYNLDDMPGTIAYLKQAVQLNALDNNSHYQLLYMLAGLQLQEDQLADGIATLDRYFAETKSQKPEELALKGQALYQQEKYAEAIPVLKQAIESSPEPKDNWQQLLMASYAEAGQAGEATQMAEKIAAKTPGDKKAQMNLASVYLQADKYDQAAAILEKLRSSGQMTDEKEYRQLYTTYANMDGKEKEVIAVINDGMQKGVLKPDQQTYLALAQSYYYSDQIAPAIEAWQKAAPLSKDGETYLNLAKVLWQEDRIPEAKQAAKSALEKGVKKPEEAKKIIALP